MARQTEMLEQRKKVLDARRRAYVDSLPESQPPAGPLVPGKCSLFFSRWPPWWSVMTLSPLSSVPTLRKLVNPFGETNINGRRPSLRHAALHTLVGPSPAWDMCKCTCTIR